MMKSLTYTLLASSLFTLGCNSSSNDNKPPVTVEPTPAPISLDFVLPEQDSMLVEDFPIALYVTYPEGVESMDTITSLDINWPHVDIHQAGKSYGFIDTDSEELNFHETPHNNSDATHAVDLERQENLLWYVSESNLVSQYNRDSEETTSWQPSNDAQYTELAINEEGTSELWLYDQKNHFLSHFNIDSTTLTNFTLAADISILGLAISEENLLLLGHDGTQNMVFHFTVEGLELSQKGAWTLTGFEGQEFSDLSLLPDGRIAVSTTASEANLFVVVDRNELLGDGPIEDSGALDLVATFDLPGSIKQPSGISPVSDGSWLVVTDQAEMYALNDDFTLDHSFNINFDSLECNQGCTEAIVSVGDDFYVLADSGLVGHFTKSNDSYQLVNEYELDEKDQTGSRYNYSGLGYNPITGEFYLIPSQNGEDQQDILLTLDAQFNITSKVNIFYSGETEGSINEFDAQGIYYQNDYLWVISEKYTKVIKLSLQGEIHAVFDLSEEDVEVPSDIVIKNGLVYIIGDHENDEPVPPVSVFEVENN